MASSAIQPQIQPRSAAAIIPDDFEDALDEARADGCLGCIPLMLVVMAIAWWLLS